MFRDDHGVDTVIKVVPYAARRTLFRVQQNIELSGQVRNPSSIIKGRGRPCPLTPLVRLYVVKLLDRTNDT